MASHRIKPTTITQAAKAITAAVSASAAELAAAAPDLTGRELLGAVLAAVVAGGAVYRVPNAPARSTE